MGCAAIALREQQFPYILCLIYKLKLISKWEKDINVKHKKIYESKPGGFW